MQIASILFSLFALALFQTQATGKLFTIIIMPISIIWIIKLYKWKSYLDYSIWARSIFYYSLLILPALLLAVLADKIVTG